MWHLLSFGIITVCFTLTQLFLVFKCIGVSDNRKSCFAAIVLYTIALKCLEFFTYSQGDIISSSLLQGTAALVHTMHIVILALIILIFADGYMPRNVLMVFIYYDVLTILPLPNTFSSILFLQAAEHTRNTLALSPYTVDTFSDLTAVIPWVIALLNMFIFALLLNSDLKNLLMKIPDKFCMGFVIISAVIFIYNAAAVLTHTVVQDYGVYISHTVSYGRYYLSDRLIIRFVFIMLLLVGFSLKKMYTGRIVKLEKKIQEDYHNSTQEIYKELRCIKHDLSNHLTAMHLNNETENGENSRYKSSLISLCDDIDSQLISQGKWQQITSEKLSSWEKYKLYFCMESIKERYGTEDSRLQVKCSRKKEFENIEFEANHMMLNKLGLLKLKSSIHYALIKSFVRSRGGSITLEKGDNTCTLCLNLK